MRLVDGKEVPRSQRICRLCTFNKIEDEMHVFECPFYNDIRIKFQNLFSGLLSDTFGDNCMTMWIFDFSDGAFKKFMNDDHEDHFWVDLANFLIACKKKRDDAIPS